MYAKRDTSNSLLDLPILRNELFHPIITVRVLIPNLDAAFEPLNEALIIPALEASLNILIFRHTPKLEFLDLLLFNTDDFIDRSDEYEDFIIENFLSEAIAYELSYCGLIDSDENVEYKEKIYATIIQNILEHYDYYFINGGHEENIEQIEFLIDYFENNKSIKIQNYTYNVESERLFLFLYS